MVQSLALPQPGDIVGRKYRVVSRVGAGGMGVVLEAINVDTEGRVALKWLNPELSSSPEAVERFKLEARATGRIRHPNVVAIHDIGEHEGHLYLVMEFLTGAPLRARIAQGALDVYEACRILFPVMRGVAAAHAVKILHRDIKPDNIFLSESPDGLEAVPKVLDFGIAKLCSDSERTGSASARTAMMGTYQYMALEQLHGRRDLDERVDVYALGAVLYNMLTGRLPYQADNPVDLALQMLQGPPAPVTTFAPTVPAGMAAVVAHALSRDRDQRYANVEQFALDLEPFAQGTRYKGQGAGASRPPRPAFEAPAEGPPSVPALRTPFQVGNTGPASSGGASGAMVDPFSQGTPLRTPTPRNKSVPPPSLPPARSAFDVDTGRIHAAAERAPRTRSKLPWVASALLVVAVGGGVAWRALKRPEVLPSVPAASLEHDAPPPLPTAPISPGLEKQTAQPAAADDWGAAEPTAPAAVEQPSRAAPEPKPAQPSDTATAPSVAPTAIEAQPQQWPNGAANGPSSSDKWPSATAKPDAGAHVAGHARERNRRPRSEAPAAAPEEAPKPAEERNNGNFGNYDMTDLPAPSWASDPKR